MKADYIKKLKDDKIRDMLIAELHTGDDDSSKFISYCLNMINNRQSVMLLLLAPQGKGKTVFQYYLIMLLGLQEKNIYQMHEYKEMVQDMPTKSIVNILDGSLLFPSRNFSSPDQKALQRQVNQLRAFENIYTISNPLKTEIDITIQRHFHEVEIRNVYGKRFAIITIENRNFVLDIPEFDEKQLEIIHELDQANKKAGFKK